MDIEQDYIAYVTQFSLALLAVTAAYFFEPRNPITYGTLLLIPLLYGYTAYISRDGFKTCSLLAFVALIFAPLNMYLASIAILISTGNVLISVFSSGNSFKDYYASVTVPMLVAGIVLGGAFYYSISLQPGLENEVRSHVSTVTAEKTSLVLAETELVDMQRSAQTQIMEDTSSTTIVVTQAHVLNKTQDDLGFREQQAVTNAFESAQQEIPSKLEEQIEEQADDIDEKENIERAVENLFEGENVVYLAPVIALFIYGLHPVIGILTALSAVSFRNIAEDES